MKEITEQKIKEVIDAIVRDFAPEQIIMFGSRARGNASRDSDVDLIIIKGEAFDSSRSRWEEMSHIWELVARYRIPVDLLLYSKAELERWKKSGSHVIGRALSEGKLLYERN